MKRVNVIFHTHKRLIVIMGLLFLTTLGVGFYSFWSVTTWDHYAKTWRQTHENIRNDLSATMDRKPKTADEYSEKTFMLSNIARKITTVDRICDTEWLTSWQSVFPSVGKDIASCQQANKNRGTIATSLTQLTTYLNDESSLQNQLSTLASPAQAVDEQTSLSLENSATKARDEVKKLQISRPFVPVRDAAIKNLNNIVEKWAALKKASGDKNRGAWEQAKADLQKAYADITSVADVSESELHKILANLDQRKLAL